MQPRRINRIQRTGALLATTFLTVGCTRTCVGVPELGSKQRPVRFAVELPSYREASGGYPSFLRNIASCLEEKAGYKVAFEPLADAKGVIATLARSDAHFGFVPASAYVESQTEKQPLTALLVRSEKGAPSTRSLIVGRTAWWRKRLNANGLALSASFLKNPESLSELNNGRIAYVSLESDIGFLVPRHLLMQNLIFPREAIFVGSYDLVLQAVSRDLATVGVVSESYVEDRWSGSTPVQLSSNFDEFVVLAISRGLPGSVVVATAAVPAKIRQAISDGLETCAHGAYQTDMKSAFGGDGFFKSNERSFAFLRELVEYREQHLRVLSPRIN